MKKKIVIALAALFAAATLMTGCGDSSDSSSTGDSATESSAEATATADNSDQVYYMISYLSTLEFWDDCFAGFEAAAEQLGVTVQYTGAEGVDAAAQITVLDQVIATNPTGIAITCCDATALNESIDRAVDSGIAVVCFDAGAEGSKAYSTLGTGNDAAAAAVCDEGAAELGETGKVGIIYSAGSPTHEARAYGFMDRIDEAYPNMSYVTANFDGEMNDAAAQASSLIAANDDLVAIFVVNANGTLGAAQAVSEAGKSDDILVLGFDTDGGMYEAIADGTVFCTARQNCYNMGYWSLQFLFAVENSLVNPIDGWSEAGLSPLPSEVDTGVDIVTQENLSTFWDGTE